MEQDIFLGRRPRNPSPLWTLDAWNQISSAAALFHIVESDEGGFMPREIARLPERVWVAHYPKGISEHLDYPSEPLPWLLEQSVKFDPTRIACRFFRQELTYEQLMERSRRMAAALLARGLRPGDRVGILLPNCPEYIIAAFGTWMAGCVTVPLNPLMVREEIEGLLVSTGCKAVVCLDLLLPLLHSEVSHKPDVVFVTTLKDRLPWCDRFLY